MGKITNTVAAVSVAAAIGGGIVVYNNGAEQSAAEEIIEEAIDDVQPVTVEIPRVTIPTIVAVTVQTPAVNSFRTVGELELAELEVPEIQSTRIEVPSVVDPTTDLPSQVALRKQLWPLIRDQRTLMSSQIRADNPAWRKWVEIYTAPAYRDYVPEFRELPAGLRIINEIKCPADASEFAVLQERLDYYARRSYNAALVTFDTTEDLNRLCAAVDYAKSIGFRVVLAYAGREHLSEPVFRDPDIMRRWLSTLGAKSDALLLGWRRTSLHLFLPDRQWTNFLIKSARSNNPDLGIIGMAYYGETAEVMRGVTYDIPENCSAILIVGLGYPRASTGRALRQLFPEVADHIHKIALTVGEKPYFDTLHATGKSKVENDTIKRRIEIRLLQAGCQSTMTYSGDGSDGAYGDLTKTENLCRRYGAE